MPKLAQTLWFTFDQLGFWAFCRRRYGRSFTTRLAGFPPIVVTSDGDAVRRLFTGDPLLRRHGNDFLKPVFGERSLFFLEPREHIARRRLELGPFHGAAVRAHQRRIGELVEQELATWKPGEVVASHPRARSLTLSVILELVLGIDEPKLRAEIASIMDWLSTPVGNLALFGVPALRKRSRWSFASGGSFDRVERLHSILAEQIRRTREDPSIGERSDVLAMLVQAEDEHGNKLADDDLRDDLVTLVVAGHEPTATTLAWACHLLAGNPEVSARLRENVANGERDYVKATAKEVLRTRPALPASAARHVLEPFPIGDWTIGPETLIFVDAVGTHADPELHGEPQDFRPERFLGDRPDSYAFVPFGGGAHRCLGAALATLELEIFLGALATRIELAPAGRQRRPARRGPTVGPGGDGQVCVARVHAPIAAATALG